MENKGCIKILGNPNVSSNRENVRCDSVEEQHQVPMTLDMLERTIAQLENDCQCLLDRLAPYLRQEPAGPSESDIEKDMGYVPIAQCIHDQTQRLQYVRDAINDATHRLEA